MLTIAGRGENDLGQQVRHDRQAGHQQGAGRGHSARAQHSVGRFFHSLLSTCEELNWRRLYVQFHFFFSIDQFQISDVHRNMFRYLYDTSNQYVTVTL